MERKFRNLEYTTVPDRCALDLGHIRATFNIPPEYEVELLGPMMFHLGRVREAI